MPQASDEKYHIVSMKWYTRWKAYTFFDKVVPSSSLTLTPSSQKEESQAAEEFNKMHLSKTEEPAELNKAFVGPINSESDLDGLIVDE